MGARTKVSSTRRSGASTGGRRTSARWPSRCRATTATGIPRSRFPSARSARASARTRSARSTRRRDGDTTRWIAGAQLDGDVWRASAYAQYYDWFMSVEPDLRLPDQSVRPALDDGRPLRAHACSKPTTLTRDRRRRVPLRRHRQRRARRVRRRRVRREHQPEQHPGDLARRVHRGELVARPTACGCSAGLRGDAYDFDATAKTPGSFEGHATRLAASSPKLGVAYTVSDNVEVYGNWGKGFHSNDARGVVNPDDPDRRACRPARATRARRAVRARRR